MAATKAFERILDDVKSSNLNFCLQLSPFSATISLKKTLVKDKAGLFLYPPVANASDLPKQNLNSIKVEQLEDIIDDLKLRLAESTADCEQAHEKITELENKLKIKQEDLETKDSDLTDQLDKKTCEINILSDEKKQLEQQFQTFIKERDTELQNLQQSLKTANCIVAKLNKKLTEIKVSHEDEKKRITKNFKSEIKSWKKNLGVESSERIKSEKKLHTLENNVKEYNSKRKVSVSSQTNNTPDVPYLVTEPLPPIFGSQVLQKTKIQALSRSLPNLSQFTLVEVTEEDLILEAAEEALNNQYDRRVAEFYEDAKAKAIAIREVNDENYIWKLFDES